VRVIKRARLNDFIKKYPETKNALEAWYKLIKNNFYHNFSELRLSFPSADLVGRCVVFNIGGNKLRLIAAIHYNKQRLYIRHILTHSEYDVGGWKNECKKTN
jgi:mRNA interferase HigB